MNPSHLAGPLYTALGQKTGLAEPSMISILKYLLHVHTLWFAMMGSNDGYSLLFFYSFYFCFFKTMIFVGLKACLNCKN